MAKRAQCLTKRALMGLLGLSSREADELTCATKPRRSGGIVYLHPVVATVDRAWEEMMGGGGVALACCWPFWGLRSGAPSLDG